MNRPAFLQWLSFQGGGFREKVVRSTIWLAIGNGSAKVVNLLKIAIMGRLLAPDDFGLMAIAILTLKWLEFFTETGFNKALVQQKGNIEFYLDTAWFVQLVRGVLLATLLFVMAPIAASFFAVPHAVSIIRTCSILLIIRSLTNPAMVYLRRELDFKRIFWWTLTNAVVGLVVAICAALWYRSVWALVASVIAAATASTLLSYVIKPYRPRPRFNWQRAKTLMKFGKWIFFLNVVSFVGLYADSAIVGKLLGMANLGFYQMARQFGMTPSHQIALLISGVMFPAFARLQHTDLRRTAFTRTLTMVSVVALPMGCFITAFADPLVLLILGSRWQIIAPALAWLAWAGIGIAFIDVSSALFQACGKPALSVYTTIFQQVLTLSLLHPLILTYGVTGAAAAVAIANAATFVLTLILAHRLIRFSPLELVLTARQTLVACVPFAAVTMLPRQTTSWDYGLALLSVSVSIVVLLPHLKSLQALWRAR